MKTQVLKTYELPCSNNKVSIEVDDDNTVRFTQAATYEEALYSNSLDWMEAEDLRFLAKKLKKLADKLDRNAVGV